MKVLAIDTATRQSSITLWENNKEIWEFSFSTNSKSYGETILINLDLLLKKSNWRLEDIELYVISKGPGSFTGLRIGMMVIKTLAQVFNKPVSAPSYLDVLAYQNKFPGIIFSILPARKNEIHLASYKNWKDFQKIEKEKVILIEEFLKKLYSIQENILIVGEIPEKLKLNLPSNADYNSVCSSFLRGASLAELGFLMFNKGEYWDPLKLKPYYGQKSSAEINWEKIHGRKE
ncbi:MAG: tRNA (adenosine(37)-N6)-threonylcarbamoyltransferase complex dimerization subunit type 1 TsaB [Dictyoglomaceae bacterium]|nr:tRNA (adenosine(37)-N6)-threonylcarbamoyltransferase complex dimerization subunit type 1 TsaB [Dictyoglomaceae bacterium]